TFRALARAYRRGPAEQFTSHPEQTGLTSVMTEVIEFRWQTTNADVNNNEATQTIPWPRLARVTSFTPRVDRRNEGSRHERTDPNRTDYRCGRIGDRCRSVGGQHHVGRNRRPGW